MANARLPKGLPRHFEKQPFWGRKQSFPWRHEVPQPSTGGIQYIPSLDLMLCVGGVGQVQLRDPITAEVKYDFLLTLTTDGAINGAYAPPANRLVVPIYNNSTGNQIAIFNLNNGETTIISSLASGTYQACYCPFNDLVYVTAWNGPTVYIVDPWRDALHTTPTVSGAFGGITLGMCYSPLNGKLYAASRSANNIYRIDPATQAIDSTIAAGGAYDIVFFSDAMGKVILLSAGATLAVKTLDPAAGDALATPFGISITSQSGTSIPKTQETLIIDNNGGMRFFDRTGTSVVAVFTITTVMRYVGWNPVTETIWALDSGSRQLFVLDPIKRNIGSYFSVERPT